MRTKWNEKIVIIVRIICHHHASSPELTKNMNTTFYYSSVYLSKLLGILSMTVYHVIHER